MAVEQNSHVESVPSVDTERIVDGYGFHELGQTIITKRFGVINHVKEQRPLFLVADAMDESRTLTEYLESIMAQRLNLSSHEADLISAYHTNSFDERTVLEIINDKRRPLILPVLIGQGDNPPWRIGPLWMFYTMNNYSAFKGQFREMAH